MLIGLVSDTHNLLRPQVFDAFEGVEHIIHAGDVGDPDILGALRTLAPVTAVWGNTDPWEIVSALPEIATVNIEGFDITVLHGHRLGHPTADRVAEAYPDSDLVVFGHSHQPEIVRRGRVLAVNPGSAGPARFTLPVTVAVAALTGSGLSARLIELV